MQKLFNKYLSKLNYVTITDDPHHSIKSAITSSLQIMLYVTVSD